MGRKEWLVSYIDPQQNLICFRLTTENTIKSLEKVLEFAQYLKEHYRSRRATPDSLVSQWLRSTFWYLVSDLRIVPISKSKFRSIPSATSVRYENELANRILRYGRSHWDRYYMEQRMIRGV